MLRKDQFVHVQNETQDFEECKTGLTLEFADIEPYLEDDSNDQSSNQVQIRCEEQIPTETVKQNKTHHAKPRFQLTSQVSNILRHVATTREAFSCGEKRRGVEDMSDSATPKKIQCKSSAGLLDKTLVVPNYLFSCPVNDTQAENQVPIASEAVSGSSQYKKARERKESNDIYYCKHCPKAFSAPCHLLAHTRNTHLCQHCQLNFPNTLARNKHIREEHNSFQCSMCSFKTQYSSNLRSHMRTVHSVVLTRNAPILQGKKLDVNKWGSIEGMVYLFSVRLLRLMTNLVFLVLLNSSHGL